MKVTNEIKIVKLKDIKMGELFRLMMFYPAGTDTNTVFMKGRDSERELIYINIENGDSYTIDCDAFDREVIPLEYELKVFKKGDADENNNISE